MSRWLLGHIRPRRTLAAVVVWVVTMSTSVPAASASPIPGLLAPGSYALNVIRSGLGDVGPGRGTGSVTVTQNGADTVERFDILPDIFEYFLTTNGTDVVLKELNIGGIYFPANPPVLWRPLDTTGQVPPTDWSWTLNSSNGGVTLRTYSWTEQSITVALENGQVAKVQTVNTYLYFSGTASGSVEIIHSELVGDSSQMSELYAGSFTFFGSTTRVDMLLVMGALFGIDSYA
jgi:hypothetical protein